MNGLKCSAALAYVLAAGCASAPERASLNVPAVPAATLAAAGGAAESGITADGAIAAENGTEVPVADIQPQDAAVVTCRELLQPASNTIVKRCASQDTWKKYDRALELWSQQQLRLWQGSPYRF